MSDSDYRYEPPQQYPTQDPGPEKDPHQRNTKRIVGIVAVFLAVAVLLTAGATAVVYNLLNNRNPAASNPTQSSITAKVETTLPTDSQNGKTLSTNKHFNIVDASAKESPNKQALSIMEIARRNKPAVVAISTEARIQNPFGQPQLVEAAGSGFIITEDGYVVTNYHVIQNSQTISITLEDGRIIPAVITGSDPRNDIAVLKMNGSGFPTVVLGDSSELETGELAVAIGNALGELSGTVTAGIISALDRQITIDNQSLVLLQTDAAINSGNSGGALINSFGEVIGINTAKNAGDGVEGLGFAIPINTAKPIIESLIQNGYVAGRPKLGIGTRDVSEQEAAYYNMRAGIYVRMVENGSSADKAGIAVGDIIIKADGKETLTTEALNAVKESHKVGDTMQITLIRNGNEMTVSVVLQEDRPETMQRTSTST